MDLLTEMQKWTKEVKLCAEWLVPCVHSTRASDAANNLHQEPELGNF